MHRRSRGVNIGLLLLLSQIFQVGINNVPPVTLATLALNIWFFLNPLKPLLSSCLSVEKYYQQKDWQRLLLSPIHHADDWHLYFNMASMLWKGIHLERRLGSRWFAYIIVTFSLLTGVVYLFLEFALAEFLNEPDFKRNCAIGFSGKADTFLKVACLKTVREVQLFLFYAAGVPAGEGTDISVAKDCWGLDFGEEADWSTGESSILLFPIMLRYSFLDTCLPTGGFAGNRILEIGPGSL